MCLQHVIQKQHKEDSRKREVDQLKEEKRKAAERLKEMKETARRKQLEYKGLISSSKERGGGERISCLVLYIYNIVLWEAHPVPCV